MLKISIASDHRGVQIKARLIQALAAAGFTISDEGTDSDQSVDYPDYAKQVASKVSGGQADRGILICGTGIGMSIAANKFPGVRAAPCYDEVMVEMSRRHNNVNVAVAAGILHAFDDLAIVQPFISILRGIGIRPTARVGASFLIAGALRLSILGGACAPCGVSP